MRSRAELLWKEWREVRWFFIVGAAIFIGWPLIDAVSRYQLWERLYSDMPAGMVLLFGGFFAILVAVGATCRDLQENIACFWQSRPVTIWRWAVTKYLVGLAAVLVVLTLPVLMQIFMAGWADGSYKRAGGFANILICHTFTLILVYSFSFATGCLIRSPVYAVIFSAALALLVYFFPMLVPPLESLSVFNIMMQSPLEITHLAFQTQGGPWFADKLRLVKIPWSGDLVLRYNIDLLRYIAFALVGSFAAVVVSAVAVKKNLRLKIGQKLMFWLVGGVGILLFLTVVFQLGSNLKCLRQIPVISHKWPSAQTAIVCEGDKGLILLHDLWLDESSNPRDKYRLWRFDLSSAEPISKEIVLPLQVPPMISWTRHKAAIAWSAEQPLLLYIIRESQGEDKADGKLKLNSAEILTISLADNEAVITDKIDLFPYIEEPRGLCEGMCICRNRIFVNLSGQLFIIELETNGKPILKSATKKRVGICGESGGRDASGRTFVTMSVELVPGEGLTAHEQLAVSVVLTGYRVMDSEKDIVVETNNDFIKVFRLKEVSEDIATLEMVGYREPLPLERLAGTNPSQVFVRDGLAYVLDKEYDFGGLTVYDIRGPQIRRVGHYAAPNERLQVIAPLPDGNILVGENKLHIVAPPKAAKTCKAQSN